MERLSLLGLLVVVAASPASFQCTDGNCTKPMILMLRDIFPFFGPVIPSNNRGSFDEAIDPRATVNTSSGPDNQNYYISVTVLGSIVSNDDDDNAEKQSDVNFPDSLPNLHFPGFQQIFERNNNLFLEEYGVLDLSGKTLTGAELAEHLQTRFLMDNPVLSLRLSNSRVQGLTSASFLPAENTLRELHMDNCTVNLYALTGLSELQMLNLSNTGLSTFQWFPQLRDSLQVLDLSHNQLDEIRPELSILSSLRELYLSHNRISSVSDTPLSMLPNLEVLTLTMNSLHEATFTNLNNLQRLDIDWNYLRLAGEDLQLPVHRVSVKLASNPWRCDCGLLEARDGHDVLDIDQLQCANSGGYAVCNDCRRYFLPLSDGVLVTNLDKDSIGHLGCTGLTDQFYLLRHALVKLRDHEPEKLVRLVMMVVACFMLLVGVIILCRQGCSKKKFDRQNWLRVQQILPLNFNKLNKPTDVPYIKIHDTQVKA